MKLFLVRHGEAASSWGQASDPGLSELGHIQASAVADELAALLGPDTQLISSPLQRARETAEPLAKHLRLPVTVNSAFAEIPTPVPLSDRQDWLRGFMQGRWSDQGEDLHRWKNTILQELLLLERDTVVFTHFLVLNTVVGHLHKQDETLHFWPDNAAVVQLQRTGGEIQLLALGRQMETVVN